MAQDATGEPGAWDEAQCRQALAQLEQLQGKLDELRMSIPSIVASMKVEHETPELLFGDFKGNVVGASKHLNTFGQAWKSADSQGIFARARQSRQANPDLSAGAKVLRYGWADDAQEEQEPVEELGEQASGRGLDTPEKLENLDIPTMLDDYRKAHPNFSVELAAAQGTITIRFKVPSLILKFIITYSQDAEGNCILNAECPGSTGLFPAITRCLALRPHPNNLQYLLDMIAAYTDTRKAKCAKCSKLLDSLALTPAARRSKSAENANGDDQTPWEPLHEGCL